MIAYLPVDQQLTGKIESIKQLLAALADYELDPGRGEIALSEIEDENWATAWKAYYKPFPVGEKLLVKPTWEDIDPNQRLVLELDPGMAFGTGSHATTMMCLETLERIIHGGERVIDVGCGSGILSIAAAKLGARQVQALDNDPVAVKVAAQNSRRNGVQNLISVRQSHLLQHADGPADIIVANIIARIIMQLIPDLPQFLTANGFFIAAGIISERLDSVLATLDEHGFIVVEKTRQDEWYNLLCQQR